MQERPKVFIAFQYDVSASSPIPSIWSCLRIELGAHEMFATRTSVAASAKDPYVINEILFHLIFL
jgi:hypothetical protein